MDVVSFAWSRAVSLRVGAQKHTAYLAQVICTFKGRIADRSAKAQQFRASGLNLVTAAIVLWNSTYITDAIAHLRATERSVSDAWLADTSPLGWEDISFSGDFLWERAAATADKRRPSISARRESLHDPRLSQSVRPSRRSNNRRYALFKALTG
jgi:hypothetical protein